MKDEFDDYLEKAAGTDELDAYLAKHSSGRRTRDGGPGAMQSGIEHFGNTALLGYLPHIQAGVSKLMPDPNADVDEKLRSEGFKVPENEESYLELRDENLKRLEDEKKAHPVASGTGTVAGIVASTAIPVGAAAKGATLGAKVAQGMKTGAAMGALANPGDTLGEIDPIQAGGRAKNAALGTALGAALPAAGHGISKGSERVAEYLKAKAAAKAARALGRPTPTEATRMAKSGEDVALGRFALDEGVIPVIGTPKRILNRVDQAKEKRWEGIDKMLKSGGDEEVVDGTAAGMKILENKDLQKLRDAGETSVVKSYEDAAEQLAGDAVNPKAMTLQKAQEIKKTLDSRIKYNRGIPDSGGAQEARFAKRTAIRDAMNDAVEKLGGGKDTLKKEFRDYGKLEKATDILERELGREQANHSISLKDYLAAAMGDTAAAKAVLGGASKAARSFGNATQARVYDAISKKAAKIPENALNPNKHAVVAQRAALNEPPIERDAHPVLRDQRLMERFRKNPGLIDAIGDERLRNKVKRAIASGGGE